MKTTIKTLVKKGLLLAAVFSIALSTIFVPTGDIQANTSKVTLTSDRPLVQGKKINVHSGKASVSGTITSGVSVTASVHRFLIGPDQKVFEISRGPGQGFGQTLRLSSSTYYPQLSGTRPGGGAGTMTLREL